MQTELHFKEHEHASEMLISFKIVNVFQIHGVSVVALNFFEVFVQDEFNPDLTDFAEDSFSLCDLTLLFKEFSQVIIAGA